MVLAMGSDRAPHRVEVVAAATPDIVDAVARLMAQLTTRYAPDAASISDLVSSPNAALILARDADNEVVGTITVAWHPTVCGLLARLETVVVSEVARRRGVASALLEAADADRLVPLLRPLAPRRGCKRRRVPAPSPGAVDLRRR